MFMKFLEFVVIQLSHQLSPPSSTPLFTCFLFPFYPCLLLFPMSIIAILSVFHSAFKPFVFSINTSYKLRLLLYRFSFYQRFHSSKFQMTFQYFFTMPVNARSLRNELVISFVFQILYFDIFLYYFFFFATDYP